MGVGAGVYIGTSSPTLSGSSISVLGGCIVPSGFVSRTGVGGVAANIHLPQWFLLIAAGDSCSWLRANTCLLRSVSRGLELRDPIANPALVRSIHAPNL